MGKGSIYVIAAASRKAPKMEQGDTDREVEEVSDPDEK